MKNHFNYSLGAELEKEFRMSALKINEKNKYNICF